MMDSQYVISDIVDVLKNRFFPTITLWNRLEGRPRTTDFDRALKAEVRDALWMLTRQWQVGEFQGDDAGSPIATKIHGTTTQLTKYRAGQHRTEAFSNTEPLEAKVEQKAIAFVPGAQMMSLDIRLLMGRRWLKLVSQVGDYADEYIQQYPVRLPDPTQEADAHVAAHPDVYQSFAAVAERRMDGASLYLYLKAAPGNRVYDGINVFETHKSALATLATRFMQWFETLFYQPSDASADAWEPSRLEYQFACSAPVETDEKALVGDEYYHGHLDWYSVDIDSATRLGSVANGTTPDPRSSKTESLLPVTITFEGMPNTRWWSFEDQHTNFGDIKPDTTDLAKLMLIEFGLIYANDWFLIPYTLPAGSIANVKGMAVTNVFGERFWIEPAGSGVDDDWQRWSMYTINTKGNTAAPADHSMLLLPTVYNVQEGNPLEEVVFIRDEMANMVWGIERTVPLANGDRKRGAEAALETTGFYQKLLDDALATNPVASPIDYQAAIRYQVMNRVPENWIPFIPAHVPGNLREIQLQRAAMPRILEGDPNAPEKVRPRTNLLREGLDQSQAYFIHEEEVPRAGIRVSQSYQRVRWYNGLTFVWLGVRKRTGRGEGASGLMFDRIIDVNNREAST